jgi:hypothetical protein
MEAQERFHQFLKERWEEFPVQVQEKLRQIVAECGNWAAELATEAILLQEQEGRQSPRPCEGTHGPRNESKN